MKRRGFLGAIGGTAAAWPLGASAQQSGGSIRRIGILTSGGGARGPIADDFSQTLAARGYRPGSDLVFESRTSGGDPTKLPGLVRELTALPVDVLVTFSYPAALAAKGNAGSVPIVAVGTGDPVASGLVAGLARPGGNITGISDVAAQLAPKRLELLKAAAPDMKKVAMLWNADDFGMTLRYRASAAAAEKLGVTVQSLGVREPNDFAQAFAAMDRDPPDGILMVADALTFLNRGTVFDYVTAHRLPAIYEADTFVRDGGLMSYGPDRRETLQRAAALVDRILKGAQPADLPFEEPTRFVLVINMKTAIGLHLRIPDAVVARADEVIE